MHKLRFMALLLPLAMFAACDGGSSDGSDDKPDAFSITGNLPYAFEGVSFNAQLGTSNGTAPVTFDWATGYTPPGWLNLGSNGSLTGTPTGVTTHSLQIEATDAGAQTATRTVSLQVLARPEITTTSLARAIKGTAYSETLTHSGTGPVQLTFALSSTSAALPTGLNLSPAGAFTGTTTVTGLFPLEIELLYGTTVVDTSILDLVVYESIPYTYNQDAFEPNDDTGTSVQLLPGATPAGRLVAGTDAIQATPLTLNSDANITKPDGDDYFKFNIGTPGTITIDVYFRGLVGEVDIYLWKYLGPPTHAVEMVASSTGYQTDDERIVYHNAQLSGTFSTGYYYLQVNAPADIPNSLYNRNAYTFRISFNDLSVETEQLEADSAGGPIDEQVVAWNQGAALANPTFSIVSGTLPNGVTFTADGRFTGTPTEFGLRDFTVQVEENGVTVEREISVRFFDSAAGDYWQVRGDRLLYDAINGDQPFEAWGDAMVVAPHPDYPTEGAIYVLGGTSGSMLDSVRVFHTDRAGIPGAKQFKFEDIGADLPNSVRYHGAAFVQHSYGGYIYCIGGEIGAAAGGHTVGDLWRGVFRLQVADGSGVALSHPLGATWEVLAELPNTDTGGKDIKGWAEFGLGVKDDAGDANDRIYLVAGRYDLEDSIGSATYSRTFHDHVLMFECPTTGAGTGAWFWKNDTAPYTPRRFPAVAMLNDRIYIAAGREGAVGQTGSGGNIADYIEMYEPDDFQGNAALNTAGSGSFPTLQGTGGYYPMFATMNGSLYLWCGWDSNFQGTRALNRFTPNGGGVGGTVTRLQDADWGTGFGGGVAHDGKLWIVSGIGHGAGSEAKNLVYIP